MNHSYSEFLAGKSLRFTGSGLSVAPNAIHSRLFPFQRDIVRWALRKGRAAIFADCGLGKTLMQVEWARHIPGRVLIFAPLCVAEQTMEEAARLGVAVHPHGTGEPIEIINYEQLHKVDPSAWTAVVLDESSILKSVDGKTRTRLIEDFHAVPFRLCCTATPAPNDPVEIGNHSAFLGIMTRAEMLASFFINRGEGNRSWDLKGHARESFYQWLASWACFLNKPSDLGYEDEGFALPPLEIVGNIIATDAAPSNGRLFPDRLKGVADRSATRKATANERADAAVEILLASDSQSIAWCGLNEEQDLLTEALGGLCVSVSGALPTAEKIDRVRRFLEGKARVLVTKPSIVGFGMNFQVAPLQVFVGLGDSYESYYQAIRRSWRFGQRRPVKAHIVLTDREEEILANVRRKEAEAQQLQAAMVGRIAEFERDEIMGRTQVAPYAEELATGDGWELWRGDAVEILGRTEPRSVGLTVFSPPFAELYTYSASERDLGNARSVAEFLEGFAHLVAALLRVMQPGRLVVCHCQQIPKQKAKHGVIGQHDFRGDLIRSFEAGGFIYHGEVTIDKNPQAQAIRTRTKGLAFAQLEKDAAWMRPAFADYLILMRAPGENALPVKPDCTRDEWIEWASPVWYHIRETDTLQVAEAREAEDEKHICALQLPTIRRSVRLWSNRGETVLSPCAGIGSEGYEAIKAGRRFVGIELKESYFRTGCKNLRAAEVETMSGLLPFDRDSAGVSPPLTEYRRGWDEATRSWTLEVHPEGEPAAVGEE